MKRASTPLCMFFFPSDPREYDDIIITYSQNNIIILQKCKNDMTFGIVRSKEIFSGYFNLTQEETNLFDSRYVLSVQIRLYSKEMGCFSSSLYTVDVEDVLNDEVITV